MTVEFKKEQIVKKEQYKRKPYIGYFSPNGELIDFNILFGESGHDCWKNIVSSTFLGFVSYAIVGTSVQELKSDEDDSEIIKNYIKDLTYPGIDEYVIRGLGKWPDMNLYNFNTFLNYLNTCLEQDKLNYYSNEYDKFKYELLLFFKNAYKNKTFFDTIGRKIEVVSKQDYISNKCFQNLNDEAKEDFYIYYLKKELMQYFKDIAVMYLGYDSLETFKPNGEFIEIQPWYEKYEFDFEKNPRIITSSYPNTNERYYNYLLMDWCIHKIPRFFYNEQTEKYEPGPDYYRFHQNENEEILEKEIQAIKKLTPLKDRYKYFR